MKTFIAICAVVPLMLAGCVGVQTKGERRARKDIQAVGQNYRPQDKRPDLPNLTADSNLADFLRFAMLNQPQVEAAYYDWAASVERITVERSLPDPKLIFEADIADVVMSLMPGLMVDLPGPGKLSAKAAVASAEGRGKYFAFENSVLQTAFALKKSFYQIYFLDDKIRINRQTLGLLGDLEKLARSQNEVGKATLQDVLRAQLEQDRLRTEIANFEDSRSSLMAQFKAALGLPADHAEPPVPKQFESTTLDLSAEQLWATALAHNPRLKEMEADVARAEGEIRMANKERVPDFSIGGEVDVKAAPVIWNPQFSMTLPIWRDKLKAQMAGAQAGKRAAQARLTAEQINLAVDFAEKHFMYREAGRNLTLLRDQLMPKARMALEIARSGYLSGQLDFLNVIDAERMFFDFQLGEVEAQTQRELALAELSLIIAGLQPASSPLSTVNPNP